MRVELHIEHLVLDGVADPRHREEITSAVRTELTRLLAEAPPRRWTPARVRRASGRAVVAGRPAQLAEGVAGAVHQVIVGGAG